MKFHIYLTARVTGINQLTVRGTLHVHHVRMQAFRALSDLEL
jgi:hypothetical protein